MKTLKFSLILTALASLLLQMSGMVCLHRVAEDVHFHVLHAFHAHACDHSHGHSHEHDHDVPPTGSVPCSEPCSLWMTDVVALPRVSAGDSDRSSGSGVGTDFGSGAYFACSAELAGSGAAVAIPSERVPRSGPIFILVRNLRI